MSNYSFNICIHDLCNNEVFALWIYANSSYSNMSKTVAVFKALHIFLRNYPVRNFSQYISAAKGAGITLGADSGAGLKISI